MKKKLSILAAGILAGTLCAQNAVTVKQKQYSGWKARDFACNQQAEIVNDKNFYQFNLLQYQPDKNGKMQTFMNISAPRQEWGFGRAPINFLSITVNGIRERDLQPNEESFRTWAKPDSAGATVTLNFDGAKVIFDVYMKKGSPVLWFSFQQPEKQLEPVRSIRIRADLVISRLLTKNGVTVWNDVYNRQAQTATRKLEQQNSPYALNADDQYIIFSDKVLDGSDKDKGFGPSFLAFDMGGVKDANLYLGNSWANNVTFTLNPDFKEFKFGIWQQKNAIANQDFMKLFEKEKNSFLLR